MEQMGENRGGNLVKKLLFSPISKKMVEPRKLEFIG